MLHGVLLFKELQYNNNMENDNKREVALKIYNLLGSVPLKNKELV